jgi:hypothetical protein
VIRLRARRAALVFAGLALLGGADRLGAQEEPVDSAQLRILERLRRLARPPGADSVLFAQDSAALAEAQAGNRPLGTARDSVTSELFTLPGFSLTEYEAESADFAAGERVLLLIAPAEGRARVTREGLVIEADTSITYNERSGRLRTVGDATFTPPDGDPVDAANMVYDVGQARGSAFDAVTTFDQEGAEWRVRGEMPYASQDSTFMSHAQFTSCDLDVPHYHFEADEIKIVGGNVLVARGVRLYFADVPVAWLPFMAQSLSRGRASGLLTPRFSVNDIVRTSGGYRRRVSNVGFYWAMSDYSDALVAMDWFSNTFTALTGSFRYRFNQHFLDGGVNARRYWGTDGSTDFAIDTRHAWEPDERTMLNVEGSYVTSNDFVREHSFNPLEVTRSIDSSAGLSRRYGWGSLSAASNRKQHLSDDRTEWTLPALNLSLSPITLLGAAPTDARFWNNMTWSGSGNFSRSTVDRVQADTFDLSLANTANTNSRASSTLRLGGFSLGQSVSLREAETIGVPEALLVFGDSADPGTLVTGAPVRDVSESTLAWDATVNYQQQLIGSTTLTPSFRLSGNMFRSDTDSLAQSFVAAPMRMSLGAQLKSDIYGQFPGFGGFQAIRHKLSPSFNYQWSPETSPSDLQRSVFGPGALQPRKTLSLTLTQTFEAKRAPTAEEVARIDSAVAAPPVPGGRSDEPRRIPAPDIVTLLALNTSIVEYDFVQADTAGFFLAGFERPILQNQISSDFLRGLSLSVTHDLFDDDLGPDGELASRTLQPHLSNMNLSFSLGSSSGIVRWLGLSGRGGDETTEPEEPDPDDPFGEEGVTDESMIVPVAGREDELQGAARQSGSAGGWNANLTYSLQRPRDPTRLTSRMLSGTLRLNPTTNWSASWRTSYDLEAGTFNDHSIRLTRDLHRWQANFDFLQTATGNWTFRFEVSLLDNRDLKFDYNQRNLDLGLPADQR